MGTGFNMRPEMALGWNRGGKRDWGFSMYGRADCLEHLLKDKWGGANSSDSVDGSGQSLTWCMHTCPTLPAHVTASEYACRDEFDACHSWSWIQSCTHRNRPFT